MNKIEQYIDKLNIILKLKDKPIFNIKKLPKIINDNKLIFNLNNNLKKITFYKGGFL